MQCTRGTVSEQYDAACQTDSALSEYDSRFYQRVDEIVLQNHELHTNIESLQQQLEILDTNRKTVKSDYNLKHSEAIEQIKIITSKENSRSDRNQSRSSGLENNQRPLNNYPKTGNLFDIDNEEEILSKGEAILQRIDTALANLSPKSPASTPRSSELNKIKFEKESALKKCVKLDSQLNTMRKSRDSHQRQVAELQEEIKSLKLFYNLHQSLSQEATLRDQYDTKVSDLTVQLEAREAELLASQHENDALAAMVRRLDRQVAHGGEGSPANGYGSRHRLGKGSVVGRFSSSSSQFSP